MQFEGTEKKKGEYVKLGDGQSAELYFVGTPRTYKAFYNGKYYEEVPETDERGGFRFSVNVVEVADGVMVKKEFQQGWNFYKQMRTLNDEIPLEDTKWKLKRSGTDTDTTYTLFAVPNGVVTDEVRAQLEAVANVD